MALNRLELTDSFTQPVPSESELIASAKTGDKEALGTLWQSYLPSFKTVAKRVGFGPEDSEDLAQEMGIKMDHLVQMYTSKKGRFKSYMFKSAENIGVDHLRKNNVRPQIEYPNPKGENPLDSLTDNNNPDPESRLLDIEGQLIIKKALLKLPFSQRVTLELGYYAGLSQGEISELINKPLGTIKTHKLLGLRKLQDYMEKEPQEPSQEQPASPNSQDIEGRKILQRLVTHLPPDQASAFALKFLCGHSTDETSQALNLTPMETRQKLGDAFDSLYALAQPQKRAVIFHEKPKPSFSELVDSLPHPKLSPAVEDVVN